MRHGLRTAAAIAASLGMFAGAFAAEVPAAPADATAAPAPDGTAPPAAPAGPVVAYVRHTKPPVLIDTSPGSAVFAVVGVAAAMAAGKDIVAKNNIADPSGDMAAEIAAAWVAVHGGQLSEAPLSDDHLWTRAKPDELAAAAPGVRYVVDVDPPGMNIIYFSSDFSRRDVLFSSFVRIIDTSNGKVIAKAKCFLKTQKTPESPTHEALLENDAAILKQIITAKSRACVQQMKTALKI